MNYWWHHRFTLQPLQAKVKALENKLEKQIHETNSNPIFFAKRIDKPRKKAPFGIGFAAPLWYDEVLVNIGKGLNAQSGIFTAPIRGYYYFHASSVSQPGKKAELLHNKKAVISKIVPKDKHSVTWFPNELQATLLLHIGDTVSVNFQGTKGSQNDGITFTGFLLRRENPSILYRGPGPVMDDIPKPSVPIKSKPIVPIKHKPIVPIKPKPFIPIKPEPLPLDFGPVDFNN